MSNTAATSGGGRPRGRWSPYVVGAGMYDVTADDIHKQFPDDPIYED
jgi:hypothetical protein